MIFQNTSFLINYSVVMHNCQKYLDATTSDGAKSAPRFFEKPKDSDLNSGGEIFYQI